MQLNTLLTDHGDSVTTRLNGLPTTAPPPTPVAMRCAPSFLLRLGLVIDHYRFFFARSETNQQTGQQLAKYAQCTHRVQLHLHMHTPRTAPSISPDK
jgi:hypothetical protein